MPDTKKHADGSRAFEENPFDPEKRRPEDIVRLFYRNDVQIVPVVSKRGILIGIIRKEDVISELSDIDRVAHMKVDEFVTRLAKKMSVDDLLPYGSMKEFDVINIFGEPQGRWPRMRLFAACDSPDAAAGAEDHEAGMQKEEQILEWMIYLILEHIPRALYAVNSKGKTIFYNSHFEALYRRRFKKDVDVDFIEGSVASSEVNEPMTGGKGGEMIFYNRDLRIHYEKVPLFSRRKKVGFLLFFSQGGGDEKGSLIPGIDIRSKTLDEITGAIERLVLVDLLAGAKDLDSVAGSLRIGKKSLVQKMKKHGIKWKK